MPDDNAWQLHFFLVHVRSNFMRGKVNEDPPFATQEHLLCRLARPLESNTAFTSRAASCQAHARDDCRSD